MIWNFGTKKATAQDKFWNWFAKHDTELYDFEFNRERVFDKLSYELGKIDPNLNERQLLLWFQSQVEAL